MKIVHVITRLILGGAQENTLITCRELARRGHDVTLITGPALGPEGELLAEARRQPYETLIVESLRRQIDPRHDVPAYFELKKAIARLRPDIVHTHSAKAGILGRFVAAAVRRRGGNRLPLIVHGVHGLSFHAYQNPLLNRFYIAVERAAASKTDFFITVADAMIRQSIAAGIGRADQYRTAYSAIDEEDFLAVPPGEEIAAFRQQHDIPASATVLVTVARLFELKGHDFIIESAKTLAERFPQCIWLFVGDGNLAADLKDKIERAGLTGRFRFTGLLQPSAVPLAIHASDVLIHCSLREGLARTLPQAMLCGKPVVAFDLDGSPEVVNADTGRLVPPRDVGRLVEACAELIADEPLRRRLGDNGREFVRRRFAPQTMVDAIEQVYRELMIAGKEIGK